LLPFVLAITVTFADQLCSPPTSDATTDLDGGLGWQLELDRDYEVSGVGDGSAAGEGESVEVSEGHYVPITTPRRSEEVPVYILVNDSVTGDRIIKLDSRRLVAPAPQAEPVGVAPKADTLESLYREYIELLKSMTIVLKTVVDEKTAKAARPEVIKIGERIRDWDKRQERLGDFSRRHEELEKKYAEAEYSARAAMYREELRIYAVPGGHEIYELLWKVWARK
jgi:hypothetical protein